MLSTNKPRTIHRAERYATVRDVEVVIAGSGDVHAAVLKDVSPTGFKALVEAAIPIGTKLDLRVGTLEPQRATAMWQDCDLVGCRFEMKLSRRALMVLARSGLYGDTASPSA